MAVFVDKNPKKRYYKDMSEQEIKQNFSMNLSALRKAKGLTQAVLAEKLNYSDKSVSKWECGDVLPDVVTISMIADFFGVTVDELIGAKVEPKEIKRGNRIIITMLSCFGAVLCAFLVERMLATFGVYEKTWLSYIYALPVAGVICVVFCCVWFSLLSRFFAVSYLVWTTGLALYLTILHFLASDLWFLFVLCAILQCMTVLVFILSARKIRQGEQ